MNEKDSLFKTEAEALTAPGEIYKHYKGGVYRAVRHNVENTETKQLGVYYEHLWPHEHDCKWRPNEVFFGTLENGEPRFKLVKKS